MKRYFTLIISITFTIVVIGTFYVKTVIADEQRPAFSIEKISGNGAHAKQLVFYGGYSNGNHGQFSNVNHYEDFRIVNNKTVFYSDGSITEKAFGIVNPKFEALIKEYRSFMRAKNYNPNNYYEDNNQLVYAEIEGLKTFTLEVDVFDKNTNKSLSFKKKLPDQKSISLARIVNVQVNDAHQVLVVVQNSLYDQENADEEFRLYTFDIDKGEVVGNDLITSTPFVASGWTDNRVILNENNLGKEKYIFIHRFVIDDSNHFEIEEEGEVPQEPNVVLDDYVVFNIETKEAEVLTIPEDKFGSVTENLKHVYDSTIYFIAQTERGSEVLPYDIESQTFGEPVIFDGMGPLHSVSFYKNNIYYIHLKNNMSSESFLKIGNMDSGDVLYEGVIRDTKNVEKDPAYEMYISEVVMYE